MFFKKLGRVSEITNKYVNSVISANTGFETEIIRTANAGEHAMSLRLAKLLPYAAGYAVETQELMSIFEGFGGTLSLPRGAAVKHGVEVFQIETRNPHLHEERGAEHLQADMLLPSLAAVYHSPVSDEKTRQDILNELKLQGILKGRRKPPRPRRYRAPGEIDMDKFKEVISQGLDSYSAQAE
jgi:mannosyl-3-phosphoglycerate synthase